MLEPFPAPPGCWEKKRLHKMSTASGVSDSPHIHVYGLWEEGAVPGHEPKQPWGEHAKSKSNKNPVLLKFPAKTTRHYKFVQQKAQHFNSRANPRLYKPTMLTIFKHQSQYCKLSLWCCKTLQTLHVIFKVCVSTYNTA